MSNCFLTQSFQLIWLISSNFVSLWWFYSPFRSWMIWQNWTCPWLHILTLTFTELVYISIMRFVWYIDLAIITVKVVVCCNFFFIRLVICNGISSCISYFYNRAGSPVVKASDFHRGGRGSNPPRNFLKLIFPFFFIKWL